MIGSWWRALKLAVDEVPRVITIIDLAGEGRQRSITAPESVPAAAALRAAAKYGPARGLLNHAASRHGSGQPLGRFRQ
jgi:hypothetical protein